MKFSLPKIATAPFCPPEVSGSIPVDPSAPFWKRALRFAGPGLLISIGYMDPGNWATAIEAGSRYGYNLLFVVLLASLAGMAVQCLCSRLGIATDLAEVLGCALAFHLLLGCSMTFGIALTAFDTLLILALQGKGFRRLEAIMLALVLTIVGCFFVELVLIKPYWPEVFEGFKPSLSAINDAAPLYIAIGIIGATVMPHNLYLHSSIVQTRLTGKDYASKLDAVRLSRIDTIGSLALALLVNASILILAAAAFHHTGHTDVVEIQDAYRMLDPLVGGAMASILFGVALLASGQSSTFTGTIAGQVIMEGYLNLRIPCWQRRLITRGLALIPAFLGVWLMGDNAVGKLLILSQVVLSLQLPFALYPLIRMTSDKKLMGPFANRLPTRMLAWFLFAVISAANVWLIAQIGFN